MLKIYIGTRKIFYVFFYGHVFGQFKLFQKQTKFFIVKKQIHLKYSTQISCERRTLIIDSRSENPIPNYHRETRNRKR